MPTRHLSWDGCVNVRDLGGVPTADGGETRFGAVVRADSIRRLSDGGWAALVAYGIRTVVDLRFGSELEADVPRELPVEVVHVPVLPEADSAHWAVLDAIRDGAPDGVAAKRDVYLEFLERFRPNFGLAVGAVAQAPDAVLVHCLAGKDRTGLVTALLLRLANVAVDEVADDYALSERNLAEVHERWIAAAADEVERARRRRTAASPREAIVQVLEELERRYGGARGYLRAAGVDERDLDAVAARLRA